jgi:PadR family transcriptional regulator PadR
MHEFLPKSRRFQICPVMVGPPACPGQRHLLGTSNRPFAGASRAQLLRFAGIVANHETFRQLHRLQCQNDLLTINRSKRSLLLIAKRRIVMAQARGEVLQGTLDLIVLKTLEVLGPLHGYGIAVRIQQVSADLLKLNQGTLYPALLRLEQRGWISSKWGVSDNNRKAKYYSLTRLGRKQLLAETESWERMAALMTRLLGRAVGA